MPGFFAALNAPKDVARRLRDEFLAIWQDAQLESGAGWTAGAHAFRQQTAIRTLGAGTWLADGEPAAYRRLRDHSAAPDAAQVASTIDALMTRSHGVVASWGSIAGDGSSASFTCDPSGAFPLYWAQAGDGIVASTHLRPLARAVGARPDPIGLLQYMQTAATVGERSLFVGVRRVRPGESVRYRFGEPVTRVDTSQAWLREPDVVATEVEERLWQLLCDTSRVAAEAGRRTLMMSAGWDSRTLLAAATATRTPISAYSHGDVDSRELQLVRALCGAAAVPYHLEPIDDRVFERVIFSDGVARTETLSFPHWHRAGALLAAGGAASVSAGVLGEVLGGHYGPAMLGGSIRRATALLGTMLASGARSLEPPVDARTTLFASVPRGIPWYLTTEFGAAVSDHREATMADIDAELARHRARGVHGQSTLIEAFITEQRGAQYIVAQSRSCRGSLDVDVPFATPALFVAASRLPLALRVHNRLNQKLLARHSKALLRFPMAATLVPARAPILVQEGSRAVRKLVETARTRLGSSTSHSGTGWVNFEFLRKSEAFPAMASSLRHELWDREAIRRAVQAMQTAPASSLHPMYDQLLKLRTLEFLLS